MTTAVRIKRKADESPADAIVLATKRARATDTEDEPAQNFTFQYAGTVDSLGDVQAAIQQVKEASCHRTDPKIHSVDLLSKLRTEHRSASKESRLQLLLQHRAILEEVCAEEITDENLEAPRESAHSLFRLYDVFDEDKKSKDTKENEEAKEGTSEVSCNDIPMVREVVKETAVDGDYVYDVYFNNLHCDFMCEDEFSLFRCGPPDAFARDPNTTYDSDPGFDAFDGEDSDDSNAEDNWRNDYPDEEHHFREVPELDDTFFEDFDTNFVSHRLDHLNFSDGDGSSEEDDPPPKEV
uniref:Probable RNA polymerase II nuclear localization protein SLC7A6OS n=1 Tax=Rhipicephalus zambeziensis TaxID=60191 RepID=A0A224Z3U9_9ACAR